MGCKEDWTNQLIARGHDQAALPVGQQRLAIRRRTGGTNENGVLEISNDVLERRYKALLMLVYIQ